MKKLLIFTYYWPPAGGVAVQRWLKFAKYLPQFGWEPIIITVENGSYPYYDESLLSEISPQTRVYRTKTFEPFELYNLLRGKRGKSLPTVSVSEGKNKTFFQRTAEYIRANFFVPDARKGWVKYAVAQAEEILRHEKIDAIVTTGPPHSAHLIGLELKKKYGIKWLADFRDPWTQIFYNRFLPRTKNTIARDEQLETEVLQTADCVVTISGGMKREFADRSKRIEVVYNGYDEEDFPKSEIRNPKSLPDRQAGEIFTIRYVGNMLASQNVKALWKALSEIRNPKYEIRIEFIGRVDNEVKKTIEQHGLADMVNYKDFVPHREAIQLMRDADLLLFVIPDVNDNELILTGKLFEYLASEIEILSFGPVQGDASNILRQCGRKEMLDYDDEQGIRKRLEQLLVLSPTTGAMQHGLRGGHSLFSRRRQTEILCRLLDEL